MINLLNDFLRKCEKSFVDFDIVLVRGKEQLFDRRWRQCKNSFSLLLPLLNFSNCFNRLNFSNNSFVLNYLSVKKYEGGNKKCN